MSVEQDQQQGAGDGTVGGRTVFIPKGKNYKILVASKLTVIRGPDEGCELVVRKEVVTIGRSKSCDLTLSDKAVSSTHAELVTVEQGRVVRDLGSKHGTFVNGERTGAAHLLPGDRLTIGATSLEILYRCRKKSRVPAGREHEVVSPS